MWLVWAAVGIFFRSLRMVEIGNVLCLDGCVLPEAEKAAVIDLAQFASAYSGGCSPLSFDNAPRDGRTKVQTEQSDDTIPIDGKLSTRTYRFLEVLKEEPADQTLTRIGYLPLLREELSRRCRSSSAWTCCPAWVATAERQ